MAATARLRHFAGFRVIRTNIRHPSLAFLSLGLQIMLALHLASRSTAAWKARSTMATLYCVSVSIGRNRVTFVTCLLVAVICGYTSRCGYAVGKAARGCGTNWAASYPY